MAEQRNRLSLPPAAHEAAQVTEVEAQKAQTKSTPGPSWEFITKK